MTHSPGGQQEQGHGVVLYDPGEIYQQSTTSRIDWPSNIGCQ